MSVAMWPSACELGIAYKVLRTQNLKKVIIIAVALRKK